jgi:putative transposase
MDLVRTNKYQLKPTAIQKAMLCEMFGISRFVFNNTLGKIQDSYFGTAEVKNGKNKGNIVPKIPSQGGIVGFSTRIKEEYHFVSRIPNDFIQGSLSNLYLATKGFFKGGGYPKFKSRKNSKQTITMKAGLRVKIEDDFVLLNKSLESSYSREQHKIKFNKHKTTHQIGTITGFTIEKDNLDKYWISITHKINIESKRLKTGKEAGIDLGIKDLIISSDGLTIENGRLTKKSAKRLALVQRRLSKKKKGSKNGKKARICVAKVHRKIRNQRNHRNHMVSHIVVNLYDFIGLETLKVKNMIQNKSLAKAIQDVAWSDLVTKILYKAGENQVSVVQIDTWYPSSKTCSRCGSVKSVLSLGQRIYSCDCGLELARDVNAALNILREAKRIQFL